MASPNLGKHDGDVRTALSAIESLLSSMQSASNTAEDIKSRVAVVFNASSGAVFQNGITSWEESLRSVQSLFSRLHEDLSSASLVLDGSNNDAVHAAGGWNSGLSSSTFATLSPR